jgi:hypothetical protein
MVARHEREIAPLLHRRGLFAEARDFLLYDFFTDEGWVNEDVFAYSNRLGEERALVVYHNRYASTRGWVRSSCAYAEKQPDGGKHLRQRTLGESFGLSADPSMFVAYRDALTGLEYLHRASEVAAKGLHVELAAYKCAVLLDWRDFRDDGIRPWGALCEMLGGGGVSSLDDAMLALELKPVHDALRAVLNLELAETLAECTTSTKPSKRAAALRELVAQAGKHARALLEHAQRYAASREPENGKEDGKPGWRGDIAAAAGRFERHLSAAAKVPGLEQYFSAPWPEDARAVLPTATTPLPEAKAIWTTVLAWCVLDALGCLRNPEAPESAAAGAFDLLRLREPMAEIFAAAGLAGEERWRAAARVRADFAHAAWMATPEPAGKRPAAAPFSWLHDPDVAWLVGLHEHEGARYLVKESYERLLWWMALRQLLNVAEAPAADRAALDALEQRLKARMRAAAESGYRIEALFESGQ